MEESAKRREKLKAMRMEAADAEVSNTVNTFVVPCHLENPLDENSATQPSKEDSSATQRFDFYTDPMSAFSGNKRNKASNEIPQDISTPPSNSSSPMLQHSSYLSGPKNLETTPSPVNQFQTNYSHQNHGSPVGRGGHYSSHQRTPPGRYGPSPLHQGTPPGMMYGRPSSQQITPPGMYASYPNQATPGMYAPPPSYQGTPPGPPYSHQGTPPGRYGPRPSHQGMYGPPSHQGTPPGIWNASGGFSSPSPGFRPRGSPGSGRGGSPYSNNTSGRGRGGRGRGGHDFVTAEERPDRFYNKSMVEDPWKFLEPVIWGGGTSSKLWLPKSLAKKKARVTEGSPKQITSRGSLAEFLVASFEEAVEEGSSVAVEEGSSV